MAPVRNATVTTIAPTGTLSIIAGCSSGIEPLFALTFVRRVMDGAELLEVNPVFERVAKERGFYSDELMKEIAEHGGCTGIPTVPEDVQRVFVTAHDITPEWHIRMQAAFQKYTDNAVSKTVNFPHSATQKDVEKVYMLAYKLGCKGVTIYRDGSRDEQVLSTGATEKARKAAAAGQHDHGRLGLARTGRGEEAAPSSAPHPRGHPEDPHGLRQPLHHDQRGRGRHLRGLLDHGQVRRVRREPVRGRLPHGLPRAPFRRVHRLDHQAGEGHPLPVAGLGRGRLDPVLPRCHRPGA